MPSELDPAILSDWKIHRRTIKKPVTTQTVINQTAKELEKAKEAGIHPDDVMSESIMRGWTGVKADWVIDKTGKGKTNGTANGTKLPKRPDDDDPEGWMQIIVRYSVPHSIAERKCRDEIWNYVQQQHGGRA